MPLVVDRPIAVFSKGKPEMTYTAEWFKTSGVCTRFITYVVSDDDDVDQYRHTTGCDVVVAEGSRNLASKRQWAVENLTSALRPWLIFFEDNIQYVTGVKSSHYSLEEIKPTTRAIYHDTRYTTQMVLQCMEQDIRRADRAGANYGGYSCNDNHFFRKRKYRDVAFVWTKMGYVCRYAPEWPAYLNEMDDYGMTAECLLKDGKVLVNNYLYPWPKKYEGRGGSRTLEERAADKRAAVHGMMSRFPGLFRIKDRPGREHGTEIQLRFCKTSQVQQWRTHMQSATRASS